MQQESAVKHSVMVRLKKLRLKTQLNWSEIAKLLGMSESMIYQALRGDRALSDKALFRLETAEGELGLTYQTEESRRYTDDSVRKWLTTTCDELEPPEIAFFLNAVIRVASEEMQKFLRNRQRLLAGVEVIKPEKVSVVVPTDSEPYLMPEMNPQKKSHGKNLKCSDVGTDKRTPPSLRGEK